MKTVPDWDLVAYAITAVLGATTVFGVLMMRPTIVTSTTVIIRAEALAVTMAKK